MNRTLHPEADIVTTSHDTDTREYVYVMRDGRVVRLPESAFARVTKGRLGVPERRAILAKACS